MALLAEGESRVLASANRLTSGFIYQNMQQAARDINDILQITGGNPISASTMPLQLLSQKHESDRAIMICFASLASDINAILAYLRTQQ